MGNRVAAVACILFFVAGMSGCRPKEKKGIQTTRTAPVASPARSPSTVCAWGTSAGLAPSRPWNNDSGDYMCMSQELKITKDALLRYYAKGDRNDVKLAYLVLTVFNPADGKRAQEETADTFRALLRSAYGDELAPSEHERIRTGAVGTTRMGSSRKVTLVKNPHVNGKGYEYRVELEVSWL